MKVSYNDLYQEWLTLNEKCESYRLGQHFINRLIKDSTSDEIQMLWGQEHHGIADANCKLIIVRYNWDEDDLPVIEGSEIS